MASSVPERSEVFQPPHPSALVTSPVILPVSGPNEIPEPPQLTPAQRRIRALMEWLIVAILALGLALLIKAFLIQAFYIPSGSMEPTLEIGDRIVIYKLGYRFHDVNRGDVIVFSKPDESYDLNELIKRVVAVGGETFELRDGRVFIDGWELDEPYLRPDTLTVSKLPIPGCVNTAIPERCEVPEGTVLVLGDNRSGSQDSRVFGPIDVDTVVGRAFAKLWPPSRIGGL